MRGKHWGKIQGCTDRHDSSHAALYFQPGSQGRKITRYKMQLTQAIMPPRASSGGRSCGDSGGRSTRHSTAPPSWCSTTSLSLSPSPMAACSEARGRGQGHGEGVAGIVAAAAAAAGGGDALWCDVAV